MAVLVINRRWHFQYSVSCAKSRPCSSWELWVLSEAAVRNFQGSSAKRRWVFLYGLRERPHGPKVHSGKALFSLPPSAGSFRVHL